MLSGFRGYVTSYTSLSTGHPGQRRLVLNIRTGMASVDSICTAGKMSSFSLSRPRLAPSIM